MEAHSALPHRKDFERVREVVERLVEEDVAQAAAEDHAEHAVHQHVVDVLHLGGHVGRLVVEEPIRAES